MRTFGIVTALFWVFGSLSASIQNSEQYSTIHLCLGANLGPHVQARLKHLLELVVDSVQVYDDMSGGILVNQSNSSSIELLLVLGNSSWGRAYITDHELATLPAESFRIVSRRNVIPNVLVVFSNGVPSQHGYRSPRPVLAIDYGAIAGAYAVLELLGFKFLHPLSPSIPVFLSLKIGDGSNLNIIESPHWPIRIFHHHTQHPLELTEVMQGLDIPMFGPHGPQCLKGDYAEYNRQRSQAKDSAPIYCERWEDMVSDMNTLYEWAVANKYNRLEWLLLGNYKWKGFDYSDTRRKRMKILTHLGNQFGLLVGADVPLGNVQQHGWYMVNPRLPYHEQVRGRQPSKQ